MAIVAILLFIGVMCAGIYLIAIYALPILAGLAAYSLLKQVDASAPMIAVASITSGVAALAAARAGASARNDIVRFATLALIAAPAGYAGHSATLQLARVFSVPEEWWTVLSVCAALAVSAFAIDMVGRPTRTQRPMPDHEQVELPLKLPPIPDRFRKLSQSSAAVGRGAYERRLQARRHHPCRSH